MEPPRTRYLDREGAALAYQVIGKGPNNVVSYFEIVQHLDLVWTDPDMHHDYERTASFSRFAYLQRRGFGLSEQITYLPSLEQQADDIVAVMDELEMPTATLAGSLGTCAALALVAAREPSRVNNMVFLCPLAQGIESAEVLHGWTAEERSETLAGWRQAYASWGSGATLKLWDPVLATPFNTRLWGMLERSGATPAGADGHRQWTFDFDIRDILRSVHVPTTVLHIPTSKVPEAAVRYVAELLPQGRFRSLPPTQPGSSIGQAYELFIDQLEEVVTGSAPRAESNRFLGTVLFTDLVSSTELLADVGDAGYRELRSSHERAVRLAVESFSGRLIKVLGDGTLSVFDSPTNAVRCAERIRREADGVALRCGVHAGEIERDGLDVTGITVHLCARVQGAADPGEILASRTVHDLVAGSGLRFTSRGMHTLKGISGDWELYALVGTEDQSGTVPIDASMQTAGDKIAIHLARHAPAAMRGVVRIGNAIQRRRARPRDGRSQ